MFRKKNPRQIALEEYATKLRSWEQSLFEKQRTLDTYATDLTLIGRELDRRAREQAKKPFIAFFLHAPGTEPVPPQALPSTQYSWKIPVVTPGSIIAAKPSDIIVQPIVMREFKQIYKTAEVGIYQEEIKNDMGRNNDIYGTPYRANWENEWLKPDTTNYIVGNCVYQTREQVNAELIRRGTGDYAVTEIRIQNNKCVGVIQRIVSANVKPYTVWN